MSETPKQQCNYLEMLPQRLRERRLRHCYTQNDMSEMLGISYHTYRGYEYGKYFPSAEVLYKIAVILNLRCDYLLGLSGIEDADDSRGEAIGYKYWEFLKNELKSRRLSTSDFADMILGLMPRRKWTMADGSLLTEARFDAMSDDTVYLKKKDGSIVAVQKSKLSQIDQDWLSMVDSQSRKSEDS